MIDIQAHKKNKHLYFSDILDFVQADLDYTSENQKKLWRKTRELHQLGASGDFVHTEKWVQIVSQIGHQWSSLGGESPQETAFGRLLSQVALWWEYDNDVMWRNVKQVKYLCSGLSNSISWKSICKQVGDFRKKTEKVLTQTQTDRRYQFIQSNCLHAMSCIPSDSINLIFADPPYNVGKKYGSSKRKSDKLPLTQYKEWVEKWISECWRILVPGGTFYLKTVAQHVDWKSPLMANSGRYINHVTWFNTASGNNKVSFWEANEIILVYHKPPSSLRIFNEKAQSREDTIIRWDKGNENKHHPMLSHWDDIGRVYAGSIVHSEAILVPETKRKIHPAQSPVALPERAILFSSNPGDLIFDPFGGIATSGVAALKNGRLWIGTEVEEQYVLEGEDRLRPIKMMENGSEPVFASPKEKRLYPKTLFS